MNIRPLVGFAFFVLLLAYLHLAATVWRVEPEQQAPSASAHSIGRPCSCEGSQLDFYSIARRAYLARERGREL